METELARNDKVRFILVDETDWSSTTKNFGTFYYVVKNKAILNNGGDLYLGENLIGSGLTIQQITEYFENPENHFVFPGVTAGDITPLTGHVLNSVTSEFAVQPTAGLERVMTGTAVPKAMYGMSYIKDSNSTGLVPLTEGFHVVDTIDDLEVKQNLDRIISTNWNLFSSQNKVDGENKFIIPVFKGELGSYGTRQANNGYVMTFTQTTACTVKFLEQLERPSVSDFSNGTTLSVKSIPGQTQDGRVRHYLPPADGWILVDFSSNAVSITNTTDGEKISVGGAENYVSLHPTLDCAEDDEIGYSRTESIRLGSTVQLSGIAGSTEDAYDELVFNEDYYCRLTTRMAYDDNVVKSIFSEFTSHNIPGTSDWWAPIPYGMDYRYAWAIVVQKTEDNKTDEILESIIGRITVREVDGTDRFVITSGDISSDYIAVSSSRNTCLVYYKVDSSYSTVDFSGELISDDYGQIYICDGSSITDSLTRKLRVDIDYPQSGKQQILNYLDSLQNSIYSIKIDKLTEPTPGFRDSYCLSIDGQPVQDSAVIDIPTEFSPLVSKTYEDNTFYCDGWVNWENASRYFMSVKPVGPNDFWYVKYHIHVWVPTDPSGRFTDSIVEFFGCGKTMRCFKFWNTQSTTIYGGYYQTEYWLTDNGLSNGFGHVLGTSILNATNYTDSAWYRYVKVDLLAYDGCEVELFDSLTKWEPYRTSIGASATDYGSLSYYTATNNGLYESSDDSDTTTINMAYTVLRAGEYGIKKYSLIMEDSTGCWQSLTSTDGPGTKTVNDSGFRLGSKIYYWYNSSNKASGTTLGTWAGLRAYSSSVDFRYSFNITTTHGGANNLVPFKPLYIKGYLDKGLFYLDETVWWTQDEPNSEDGKIYIKVCQAVNQTYTNFDDRQYNGDLLNDGGAWWYKNGRFQRYYDADWKADKVSNAKEDNFAALTADGNLKDSGYTHSNYVTDIAADTTNDVLKITKGSETPTSLTVPFATKAGNMIGGAKGSIPYQTAANTTALLGIGSAGNVLSVSSSGIPEWKDIASTLDDRYLKLSGGTITGNLSVNGNTTLGDANSDTVTINGKTTAYSDIELNSSTGNSPSLIFNRAGSGLDDWRIYVKNGHLYFASAQNGSTWTDRVYIKDHSSEIYGTLKGNADTATTATTATKLGTSTIGSEYKPIFLNSGTPTAITSIPGSLIKGSGINSMLNSSSGVGINPAINGAGMNIAKGGSVVLVIDDFKFKMSETNPNYLDVLFDGVNSTYFQPFCPQSAIDVDYHTYSSSNTYSIGDIVIYKNTEDKVRWYRSKTNSNTGNSPTHETDNTYWEYVSGTGNVTYAIGLNPQKFSSVSLLITLSNSSLANNESGLSIYWRAVGQHPKYLTVEKYSDANFTTLAGTCCTRQDMTGETVTSVYCGVTASSQGKYFKLIFEDWGNTTNFWACVPTQIAFTGLTGGIEGTVVMRKGGSVSTMFGDFYPNDTETINLGTSSKKWNNVYAKKFITSGGTNSQFVKGDGSLDSKVYAPLASPALTGIPTAPTASDGTNSTQIATTAFVNTALNKYLPTAGGTMTGAIERQYNSASNSPVLKIGTNNKDIQLFKVYSNDVTYSDTVSAYGYSLKYIGTGSGVTKYLRLIADNQTSTQLTAISVNQNGQVGILCDPNTSYALSVTGNIKVTGTVSSTGFTVPNNTGFLKADGSVDTNTYLTSSDISTKADKVNSAINGDFAGLNSSGNLTDSGYKHSDFVKVHPEGQGHTHAYNNYENWNFILPQGSTNRDYIKIELPVSAFSESFTMYMDMSIVQSPSVDQAGRLCLVFQYSSIDRWTRIDGVISGHLSTTLTACVSDTYVYISGIEEYGSVSIDKILCSGRVTQEDLTQIQMSLDTTGPSSPLYCKTMYGTGSILSIENSGISLCNTQKDELSTISISDISSAIGMGNKADKVSGATSGDFAGLDANGNLTDSGHKHSDYVTNIGVDTVNNKLTYKTGTGSGQGGLSYSLEIPYATASGTATNLASAPAINIGSDGNANKISVTAGGLTSSWATVPYATMAGSATDSNAVHLTGAETITGLKTISDTYLNFVGAYNNSGITLTSSTTGATTPSITFSRGGSSYLGYKIYANSNGHLILYSTSSSSTIADIIYGSSTKSVTINTDVTIDSAKTLTASKFSVPSATAGSYIKADGTGYGGAFTGATSSSAGGTGLVPAPTVADKDKFLKGDGTWSGFDDLYLRKTGGSLLGDLSMTNHVLTGLKDPVNDTDAVNKRYLESVVGPADSEVAYPDPTVDVIDGTKKVSYAYITHQSGSQTPNINELGFKTPMEPNSCIHIFVYSSMLYGSGGAPKPNTYSNQIETLVIPGRLCGGMESNVTPGENDYTFINGRPMYLGPGATPTPGSPTVPSQSAYVDPEPRLSFIVPPMGMIEVSIYYNTYEDIVTTTVGGQTVQEKVQYSRTIVKCDGQLAS